MTEGRRGLVGWLLGGGLVTSILSFIYPAIKFMMPPNVPEAAVNEVVAGKVQMLKPDAGSNRQVRQQTSAAGSPE